MADWIATLSEADQYNWTVCKRHNAWGTGSNRGGGVQIGDTLWIYQAGSYGGYIAKCEVTGPSTPPSAENPAPWDDDRTYRWRFNIAVHDEPRFPLRLSCAGRVQDVTNLETIRLGQFPRLDDDAARALNERWWAHMERFRTTS